MRCACDGQPLLALVLVAGAPPGRCGGYEVTVAAGVGAAEMEISMTPLSPVGWTVEQRRLSLPGSFYRGSGHLGYRRT